MVLAYDGLGFHGWQAQPGLRTVQGEVQAAIATMVGTEVDARVASRTDAGVHAQAQVVAFDAPREIRPVGWLRGLNRALPRDIAIQRVEPCPPGYNPRFFASAKTYRYVYHVPEPRDPLLHGRAWHLGPERSRPYPRVRPDAHRARHALRDWLDIDAMSAAARHFVGDHDFRAFRAARDPRQQTRRRILESRIVESHAGRPDLLAFEVRGSAFMLNMVRIMAGTLMEVGRERISPSQVQALLTDPGASREHAGETAPAAGLYLIRVELNRTPPVPVGT